MRHETLLLIPLAAICVHVLPGCGARSDLPTDAVERPRCAKLSTVRPTAAPRDFVLKEIPGAHGSGNAVVARPNGDILLAGALAPGTYDLGGGPGTVPSVTAFIASFDAAGNHQWDRIYPEASSIVQIALDPEGNILAAADVGNEDGVSFSGLFLKLDPAGDPLWTKAWSSVVYVSSQAFDVDGCGNVFLTGTTDETSRAALGVPGEGVFVAAYDPSGHVLWGKSFGGIPPTPRDSNSPAIALDDQREILLTGTSDGPGGTDTSVDFGDGDAPTWYLAKLTATGDPVWQQSWGSLWPATPPWIGASTFGGLDAFGNAVVVVDVIPGVPPGPPTGPAVVTAQRFDPSGQVLSTTPLALAGSSTPDLPGLSGAAVAPSGSLLVARFDNEPTDTWMLEVDAEGAPIWSWPHPSDEQGSVYGLGFDPGGRPLGAGQLMAPGAPDEATVFLAFDASPR